jgi:hypothetical protein
LGIVAVLTAVLPACALLRGDSGRVRPPLETPEPPPREVVMLPAVPVEAGPTPVIVPAGQAPGRVQRPLPPKAADKSEPQPAVPPVEPVPAKPVETAGGSLLQTTPDVDAAERRVRDLLARAVRDLAQLDDRALSQAEKTQYDAARRFVAQAEDALKARNLRFAEQLADKAAGLAAGLKGR